MSVDLFKLKFESKSNAELEEIARNNIKYVLDARVASITIMKSRNLDSYLINVVENELKENERQKDLVLKNEQST